MEEFDLVDEKDNIIGKITRDEAHEKGLLHRAIAIYVYDEQGRLYVQRHKKSNDRLDHSVGGHVGLGESYLNAAIREAKEELNLTAPLIQVTKSFVNDNFSNRTRHNFMIYECYPGKDWKFIPNDEVSEIVPMEIKDIVEDMNKHLKTKYTGGFLATMSVYLKIKNLPYQINEA